MERGAPTRVHSRGWRPKARLLCPCCGGTITDWSEFAETYRRWRFGRADDNAFMRHAGLTGPRSWAPFPDEGFAHALSHGDLTRGERDSIERERRWQGGA